MSNAVNERQPLPTLILVIKPVLAMLCQSSDRQDGGPHSLGNPLPNYGMAGIPFVVADRSVSAAISEVSSIRLLSTDDCVMTAS